MLFHDEADHQQQHGREADRREGETISFGGWTVRVRLDEKTLRAIADITHGEYFRAATRSELERVYRAMSSRFEVETRDMEISALFAAAGALLLTCGLALSIAWFGRAL